MVNHTKKRQHVGLMAAAAILAILATGVAALPSAAADDTGCQSWHDGRGLPREHCALDACLEDETGYRLGFRTEVQIGVMPRTSSQRC